MSGLNVNKFISTNIQVRPIPQFSLISSGLRARWTMQENVGSTTASDATGNGYTMTRYGSPVWNPNDASLSGVSYCTASLNLTNGSTQYLRFSSVSTLSPEITGSQSYVAWAKNCEMNQSIIGNWETAGGGLYYLTNGTFQYEVYVGSAYRATVSPLTYAKNQWHLVVGTYDGSTARLYIDGNLVDSQGGTAGPIKATAYPMAIGVNPGPTYVDYFSGSIGECRVYNRALSLSEIQTIYNRLG